MRTGIGILFRLVGALVWAGAFIYFGRILNFFVDAPDQLTLYMLVAGAIGAIIGLITTPMLINRSRLALTSLSSQQLGGGVIGLITGLFAALLFTWPLSQLPSSLGSFLPLLFAVSGGYLGFTVGATRSNDLVEFAKSFLPAFISRSSSESVEAAPQERAVLLDTSVIIDGRIADVSKTGFLNATMLVPSFVLHELQNIADSPDPIRRKRGRRGLEVLNVLRTECPLPFKVTDMDVSEVRDVDTKLVALARHLDHAIMTNDYNLNRVAGLQGVNVLNINDLANAIKSTFLPGEELAVKVIQEGREYGQGVGYLDDGTMVVIEDGNNHMNATLEVVVTKVLQTSAGRMIFARIVETNGH
jgi:uncharacterized protein YacL